MSIQSALIIGCGKIGKTYASAMQELGVRVNGVADVVSEQAEDLAKQLGASPYDDYHRMLRECHADFVGIATPTWHHKEPALLAAEHGINIFCEKPLATNLDDTTEMVCAASQNRVLLGVGFKMRFESVFAAAKRAIDERKLGNAQHIFINHFQPLPDVNWYLDEGVIAGLLVHSMDLGNWFLDSTPSSVKATAMYKQGRKGEDQAFMEFTYDGSRKAIINGGYVTHFPKVAGTEDLLFQVVCERGYVVGRRPDFLMVRDEKETVIEKVEPVNAFKEELRVFLKALSSGENAPVSGIDGVRTQAMIEAAYCSTENDGDEVEVSKIRMKEGSNT